MDPCILHHDKYRVILSQSAHVLFGLLLLLYLWIILPILFTSLNVHLNFFTNLGWIGPSAMPIIASKFHFKYSHSAWVKNIYACKSISYRWWASSSDTLIDPFIFAFPSLSLHHWSTPTHLRSDVIALALSDRSRLFDGHMTYDSHVFTSILSVSNMPPPAVRPIMRSRTAWSGTFCSFTICSHSCLPFVFNLTVFTFHQGTSSPKPWPIAYMSLPQIWDFALTLRAHFTLFRTISLRIALPQSHCLYLPQYTWRHSLTPRLHPLRAP